MDLAPNTVYRQNVKKTLTKKKTKKMEFDHFLNGTKKLRQYPESRLIFSIRIRKQINGSKRYNIFDYKSITKQFIHTK